jgi:hypothetical protein
MAMNFFILTGSQRLAEALSQYIIHSFPALDPHISFGYLGHPASIIPKNWNGAEILIADAFNPENRDNPEGWRTAKKSGKKALLLFSPAFSCLKSRFFTATSALDLGEKMEAVLHNSPPSQGDFEALETLLPALKRVPFHP